MMAGANSAPSLATLLIRIGIAAGDGMEILSWLLVCKIDVRNDFDIRLLREKVMQELRQLLLA